MKGQKRTEGRSRFLICLAALCTVTSNAGAQAHAAQNWPRAAVNLHSQVQLPPDLLKDGERAVTSIYAGVHIELIWRVRSQTALTQPEACTTESVSQELAIEIVPHAPTSLSRDALAMAMPYADSGVRIMIFFDRVEPLLKGHHAPQAKVLGYVLAHEIGHVLQGVARHSETGIMRAHWTENDFKQMAMGELTFTNEDVQLIRRRLTLMDASVACSGPAQGSNQFAKLEHRPTAD